MGFEWHGDEILARLRQAEEAGLNETLKDAVDSAKHYVRVDTGELQSKIEVVQPAQAEGDCFTGEFGVEGVAYALAQEFGRPDLPRYGYTPYLRPALDINAPKLAGNIKKHFGG